MILQRYFVRNNETGEVAMYYANNFRELVWLYDLTNFTLVKQENPMYD